jgi:hypothetical protein
MSSEPERRIIGLSNDAAKRSFKEGVPEIERYDHPDKNEDDADELIEEIAPSTAELSFSPVDRAEEAKNVSRTDDHEYSNAQNRNT